MASLVPATINVSSQTHSHAIECHPCHWCPACSVGMWEVLLCNLTQTHLHVCSTFTFDLLCSGLSLFFVLSLSIYLPFFALSFSSAVFRLQGFCKQWCRLQSGSLKPSAETLMYASVTSLVFSTSVTSLTAVWICCTHCKPCRKMVAIDKGVYSTAAPKYPAYCVMNGQYLYEGVHGVFFPLWA